MADHIKYAFIVDAGYHVKLFFAHSGDQPILGDARIVYQNVNAPKVSFTCFTISLQASKLETSAIKHSAFTPCASQSASYLLSAVF